MKIISAFLILAISWSCGNNPDVKNFDNKDWKKDKNGCLGIRAKQIENLFNNRLGLKGVREDVIISYLGLPDQQDLLTRGQKMYKYWVSGSSKCKNPKNEKSLIIRFNAVNKATEIFME